MLQVEGKHLANRLRAGRIICQDPAKREGYRLKGCAATACCGSQRIQSREKLLIGRVDLLASQGSALQLRNVVVMQQVQLCIGDAQGSLERSLGQPRGQGQQSRNGRNHSIRGISAGEQALAQGITNGILSACLDDHPTTRNSVKRSKRELA